jgi:3-methyladenine DNA glycosylase AlkD
MPDTDARLAAALAALESQASPKLRDEMASRYGIVTDRAMGVPMAKMQAIAKTLGRDHALAAALWETGWYEARMLAALIDEPERVTPEQMDHWRADFDNWAIVDTVAFKLFDQVPHAWGRVDAWAGLPDEFGRRAAFALLASLALHGRGTDADFLARLPLIEAAASDGRNFVKKGVSWALRSIGGKKSPALRQAARDLAARLAASPEKTARWIAADARRAFAKADDAGGPRPAG